MTALVLLALGWLVLGVVCVWRWRRARVRVVRVGGGWLVAAHTPANSDGRGAGG